MPDFVSEWRRIVPVNAHFERSDQLPECTVAIALTYTRSPVASPCSGIFGARQGARCVVVPVSSHKRSRPSPRLPVVYIYGRRSGSRQPLRRSTPQITCTLDHKTYTRSSTSTTPENIRLSQYFVRSFAFKMESYLNSPVCTE